MSNSCLPPEILDLIVDLLHDDPNALKGSCLVSKSWIPRTRRHLFAKVGLRREKNLRSWKKLFSDPSTSPARFAKSLQVGCARAVTAADAEVGGWLTGFAHIVHLDLETQEIFPGEFNTYPRQKAISLVPFHGFSAAIKSLRVNTAELSPSRIFDFILSSPLLEDLTVSGYSTWVDDGDGSDSPPTFVQPSNPPVLTGSLGLSLVAGIEPVVRRLLSIPGGIHFRKLTLTWHREEGLPSIIALVGECSHTLESLNVTCYLGGNFGPTSVDLSRATRLKDVTFRICSRGVEWVTTALRTIAHKHRDLRQISISAAYLSNLPDGDISVREVEQQTTGQWLELDRLLAQLWESHSIPPEIMYRGLSWDEKDARGLMRRLLPEATRGGTVNLVDAW